MKQLRFLIARIDRIGDVVLSTPLPREIKKKHPNSFVAVLVKHYTKDVYFNNPNVDEIIISSSPKNSVSKQSFNLPESITTWLGSRIF